MADVPPRKRFGPLGRRNVRRSHLGHSAPSYDSTRFLAGPVFAALVLFGHPRPGCATFAVFNALWTTLLQSVVRNELIARVSSFDAVRSYVLSPVGPVAAAAVAQVTGTRTGTGPCCGRPSSGRS